jgi:hypothetical protein
MRKSEPEHGGPREASLFELWIGMTQEAWEALGQDVVERDDPPARPV